MRAMARENDRDTAGPPHPLRQGVGFLVSGGVAFAIDALVLELLMRGLGVSAIFARVVSIALAMVVAWLMHRRLTFAVAAPPSVAEFLRYAGVAWTAAAINYAVFVLIVLVWPGVAPLAALVASSLVAMVFAYLGMRFAAFRYRPTE